MYQVRHGLQASAVSESGAGSAMKAFLDAEGRRCSNWQGGYMKFRKLSFTRQIQLFGVLLVLMVMGGAAI